jgi:hypothetical protein
MRSQWRGSVCTRHLAIVVLSAFILAPLRVNLVQQWANCLRVRNDSAMSACGGSGGTTFWPLAILVQGYIFDHSG